MTQNHNNPKASSLGPVVIDVDGLELTEQDKELLQHPLVGGLIFFARNFESRQQIMALVQAIRVIRPNLLLAVDQEGGRVQRFKEDFTLLPPMQRFWQTSGGNVESQLALVQDCGWLLASEILACDIDISFAPVLDVDDNRCEVIAHRSFSPDPQAATMLAKTFVAGMHAAGMACTGKHFPGHGGVTADSHMELPNDERSYAELEARDLIPFSQLSNQLDAIMPAHLYFPNINAQPVGFSTYWLQDILRAKLGFKGIIFSDDLTMAGAAAVGTYGERAEQALAAGCDAVLVCNNRAGAVEVIERLEQVGIQPNDRLALMRARAKPQWSSLESDKRYRQAQTRLADLLQSPLS